VTASIDAIDIVAHSAISIVALLASGVERTAQFEVTVGSRSSFHGLVVAAYFADGIRRQCRGGWFWWRLRPATCSSARTARNKFNYFRRIVNQIERDVGHCIISCTDFR
jgi:hypothetical protein